MILHLFFFFFQAEDGIRDVAVTGVQTCALPVVPTFLRLNAGSPPRVPGRTAGNWERGLRSLRDLTQHLTTRADDSHAAPVLALRRGADVSTGLHQHVKPREGSSRCFELNHMLHRLCGPPSIPLSFSLAAVLPTL